jgi:hypothetical protein
MMKKAEDENRSRTQDRMRTSKNNYEFNDSMRTRKGWVPGQLAGPRTEKRQEQWRTRTVGGKRTRGESSTRTEQDKGQEENNDRRRTKKGREQENLEDKYKMSTMSGDRERQGKEEGKNNGGQKRERERKSGGTGLGQGKDENMVRRRTRTR